MKALVDANSLAAEILENLLAAAKDCFKEDLLSVVLFGSGADGNLRPSSDLNLLIVLKRFERERVDLFREPLRAAHVAGRAEAMFILEAELPAAAESFAVKFDDIERRRKVLFGDDPFAALKISNAAKRTRLRQVLMNYMLRLRERYVLTSLREERLVSAIADSAGPLRSAAATLLELEGRPAATPKEALACVAGEIGGRAMEAAMAISPAREEGALPSGMPGVAVFDLLSLSKEMLARVERLG